MGKPLNIICISLSVILTCGSIFIVTFIFTDPVLSKLIFSTLAVLSLTTQLITVLSDPGYVDRINCPFDFSEQHVVLDVGGGNVMNSGYTEIKQDSSSDEETIHHEKKSELKEEIEKVHKNNLQLNKHSKISKQHNSDWTL